MFLITLSFSNSLLKRGSLLNTRLCTQVNNTLTELRLDKFSLGDFGVERLCDGLYHNQSLLRLTISNNRMSRDAARPLSRLIRLNTPLRQLDLSNNRLEREGLTQLASALAAANTNLRSLNVRYNEAKGAGLTALAKALLTANKTLTNLYVWGNEVECTEAAAAFGKLLKLGRVKEADLDVRPYRVTVPGRGVLDMYEERLAESSNSPDRLYYWTPTAGADLHKYDYPQEYPCTVGDGVTRPACGCR